MKSWPLIFRLLAKQRYYTDKGIGDTIERIVGPVGGDAFKKLYKSIMKQDCGCNYRRDLLNKEYPYVT